MFGQKGLGEFGHGHRAFPLKLPSLRSSLQFFHIKHYLVVLNANIEEIALVNLCSFNS